MDAQKQSDNKFNPMGGDNSQKQQQPAQQSSGSASGATRQQTLFTPPNLYSKILVSLLIVLSVVALLALGAHLLPKSFVNSSPVKEDQYQLVFLSNNQFYFGKLNNIDSSYVTLSDIFYLQVDRQVQPERGSQGQRQAQQNVSLTKLGNELHGPEDVMYISRDKIVYWENLKGADQSRVVEAIERYKAGNGQQGQNQQQNDNNQQQSPNLDTNGQQEEGTTDETTTDETTDDTTTDNTNETQSETTR